MVETIAHVRRVRIFWTEGMHGVYQTVKLPVEPCQIPL